MKYYQSNGNVCIDERFCVNVSRSDVRLIKCTVDIFYYKYFAAIRPSF